MKKENKTKTNNNTKANTFWTRRNLLKIKANEKRCNLTELDLSKELVLLGRTIATNSFTVINEEFVPGHIF